MSALPGPLARVIEELRKLPGIGPKSAQRLALHLVRRPPDEIAALATAVDALREGIRPCSVCHQITDVDPCAICANPLRERDIICVVEQPTDLLAVEDTGEYRGLYHVLHGVLNPLGGVGPESLTVDSLERRLAGGDVREVILATNAGVEGEATAAYLARRLQRPELRLSRPAQGLPAGGELEFTDRLTLTRALRGRRDLDR